MYKIPEFLKVKYLLLLTVLLGLFFVWTYKGISETGIHVDLARDLNFLSDIWIHKIVWLGPMTSANFPTSPLYYYLLVPGLLLSGGNGLSVIVSQTFFALAALGLFAYFQLKKSAISAFFVILAVGLSPWWITSSAFPWNGHMYVAWVFLALTSLWFKNPIFVSALLFGISIAIDPAALLALPIIFYEWIANANRLKNLILIIIGLLLPWTPIIIFEIITNGFLTRQWLQYPAAAGITFSPKSTNIFPLLNILRISPIQAIIVFLISFFIGSKRAKYWLLFTCLPVIFLILVTPLRQYYLLGLVSALTFTFVTILSSKTIGRIILVLFVISYLQTLKFSPLSIAERSITGMNRTVETFIQQSHLDKTKKYAVVSVRDLQNSTPQADDYRFFLRTKGVAALSIDEYPQADILLLFIEIPNFNWQNFEDWHMQRFGKRKFLSKQNIGNIEIIIYGRE